jgi:hypothetical protein
MTWKQLRLWKYLGLGYVMAASGRIQYDYKQTETATIAALSAHNRTVLTALIATPTITLHHYRSTATTRARSHNTNKFIKARKSKSTFTSIIEYSNIHTDNNVADTEIKIILLQRKHREPRNWQRMISYLPLHLLPK